MVLFHVVWTATSQYQIDMLCQVHSGHTKDCWGPSCLPDTSDPAQQTWLGDLVAISTLSTDTFQDTQGGHPWSLKPTHELPATAAGPGWLQGQISIPILQPPIHQRLPQLSQLFPNTFISTSERFGTLITTYLTHVCTPFLHHIFPINGLTLTSTTKS